MKRLISLLLVFAMLLSNGSPILTTAFANEVSESEGVVGSDEILEVPSEAESEDCPHEGGRTIANYDETHHVIMCDVCGDELELELHDFSDNDTCFCGCVGCAHSEVVYVQENGIYHFVDCAKCGEYLYRENHVFDGDTYGVCVCGQEGDPNEPLCQHDTSWYFLPYDTESHSVFCGSCEVLLEQEPHDFSDGDTCHCGEVRYTEPTEPEDVGTLLTTGKEYITLASGETWTQQITIAEDGYYSIRSSVDGGNYFDPEITYTSGVNINASSGFYLPGEAWGQSYYLPAGNYNIELVNHFADATRLVEFGPAPAVEELVLTADESTTVEWDGVSDQYVSLSLDMLPDDSYANVTWSSEAGLEIAAQGNTSVYLRVKAHGETTVTATDTYGNTASIVIDVVEPGATEPTGCAHGGYFYVSVDEAVHQVYCAECKESLGEETHDYNSGESEGMCACGAKMENIQLVSGEPVSVDVASNETVYFCFTPEQTGYYMFSSSLFNGGDRVELWCDAPGYTFNTTAWEGYDSDRNRYFDGYLLEAGTTYTLSANNMHSYDTSVEFVIQPFEKAENAWANDLDINLVDGQSCGGQARVEFEPWYTMENLVWESSDPDVIRVEQSYFNLCEYIALTEGEATLTATLEDGTVLSMNVKVGAACPHTGEREIRDFEPYSHAIVCLDCGEYIDFEPHEFVDGVCICGATPPCEHEKVVYSPYDENNHFMECVLCGETFYASHEYVDGSCICGETEPAGCAHSNIYYEEISDTEHVVICSDCGQWLEYLGHDYDDEGLCVCGAKLEFTWLSSGEPVTVDVESYGTVYFRFTPEQTGYYMFSSSLFGDADRVDLWCDAPGYTFNNNYSWGYDSDRNRFFDGYLLDAGTTYTLSAHNFLDYDTTVEFVIQPFEKPESVNLNTGAIEAYLIGDEQTYGQAELSFEPWYTMETVVWESSDSDVVRVEQSYFGVCGYTALSAGEATLTATLEDGTVLSVDVHVSVAEPIEVGQSVTVEPGQSASYYFDAPGQGWYVLEVPGVEKIYTNEWTDDNGEVFVETWSEWIYPNVEPGFYQFNRRDHDNHIEYWYVHFDYEGQRDVINIEATEEDAFTVTWYEAGTPEWVEFPESSQYFYLEDGFEDTKWVYYFCKPFGTWTDLQWSSNDDTIARVEQSGDRYFYVSKVGEGSTTIVGYDENENPVASFDITVLANVPVVEEGVSYSDTYAGAGADYFYSFTPTESGRYLVTTHQLSEVRVYTDEYGVGVSTEGAGDGTYYSYVDLEAGVRYYLALHHYQAGSADGWFQIDRIPEVQEIILTHNQRSHKLDDERYHRLRVESVLPETAEWDSVDWYSSDDSVVYICSDWNNEIEYYVQGEGTATITATINGVSASCEIIVEGYPELALDTPVDLELESGYGKNYSFYLEEGGRYVITRPRVEDEENGGYYVLNAHVFAENREEEFWPFDYRDNREGSYSYFDLEGGREYILFMANEQDRWIGGQVLIQKLPDPVGIGMPEAEVTHSLMDEERFFELCAWMEPDMALEGSIRWETSDSNVAEIWGTGGLWMQYCIRGAGEAIITATDEETGATGSFKVIVEGYDPLPEDGTVMLESGMSGYYSFTPDQSGFYNVCSSFVYDADGNYRYLGVLAENTSGTTGGELHEQERYFNQYFMEAGKEYTIRVENGNDIELTG